jgi:putative transcriptional regulator
MAEVGSMRTIRALLMVGLVTLALSGNGRSLYVIAIPASLAPPAVAAPDDQPAAGMLLIAQRDLFDPYFAETVILLLQHDDNGTVGLIVNRKFNMQLSDAVSDIDKAEASKHALFFGGPLGTHRIFMLMRNAAAGEAHQITANIYFSAHRDVLEQALDRKTPDTEMRLFLGYSSWAAGQLDQELARDSWHLATADPKAIFDAASDRLWERLIEILEPNGIEVKLGPAENFLNAESGLDSPALGTIVADSKEFAPL